MTGKGREWLAETASPMDRATLARLSALLEGAARGLGREERRAAQAAMRRAQSGSLTAEEQFADASGFFGLEIVRALQERAEQVMEATKRLARPGPDRQERLMALSRLVSKLLGLDFLTFCYLVHVAHVASLLRDGCGKLSRAAPDTPRAGGGLPGREPSATELKKAKWQEAK